MFRRKPFVIHVCVSELDVLVTNCVIKPDEDFHLVVIDGRTWLFFYADLHCQIRRCVWIGRLGSFDLSNAHDRAFRIATNILMFLFRGTSRRVCDVGLRLPSSRYPQLQALVGHLICGAGRRPYFLNFAPRVIRTVE